MKKFITSLSLFLAVLPAAYSQISKGSILLGGGIGFGSYKSKTDIGNPETKKNNFLISPVIGFAIKENLIVGGDIVYGYGKNSNMPISTQKTSNIGAGVFVRKYFPISSKFYFFGQGRLGGGYFETKTESQTNANTKFKGWNADIGIMPGVSVAVKKSFHLEAGFNNVANIGFQHGKGETIISGNKVTTTTNSFSFSSSLSTASSSLFFGCRWILPG